MPNLSQGEATALLGSNLLNAAYTAPTAWYVALIDSTKTQPAGGTLGGEVSGGSYGRLPVTFSAVSWNTTPNPPVAQTSNAASPALSFTNMPAVTTSAIEIYTAATGTTRRLWFGALTTAKTTAAGDTLSFATGAIVATMN